MDLFLAISQGIGTSLATGMRIFLAALVVGAFARLNAGVDFEGTEYDFLESVVWLVLMLLGVVAVWWLERAEIPVPPATWGVAAAAIGAVLFAGALAERDYAPEPGLAAGAVVAVIGFVATAVFVGGAGERLAARGEARLLAHASFHGPPVSWVG